MYHVKLSKKLGGWFLECREARELPLGQAAHPLSEAGAGLFTMFRGCFRALPLAAPQHADTFTPVKHENSILSYIYRDHDRAFKSMGTAGLEPSLPVTIPLPPTRVTLPTLG